MTKSKEIISILTYNILPSGIRAGGKKEICVSRPLLYIPVFFHGIKARTLLSDVQEVCCFTKQHTLF